MGQGRGVIAVAGVVFGAVIWWLTTRGRQPDPLLSGAETAAASFRATVTALPFEPLSNDPQIRQLAAGIPQEMSAQYASSGYAILTPSSSADGAADPCATAAPNPLTPPISSPRRPE
jgi:hypothetical protein